MALAGMLSAMREIILNAPEIPEEEAARKLSYKKLFPFLSIEELEDLSKIPPKQFGIYTTSIFMGEKGLIENNFPMTVKVLEKYWPASSHFSLYQLVKDLHKVKPWKSTASVALGRNFVEYLRELSPEIHSAAPYLCELAEMELAIRKARKFPDDPREAGAGFKGEALSALTVEQIMSCDFYIPLCSTFREFNFDLIQARSHFLSQDDRVPSEISASRLLAVLSRDAQGFPRWTILDETVYHFLAAQPKGKLLAIEPLAEAIVASLGDVANEEEMFVGFLKGLSRLMLAGCVTVFERTATQQSA